MQTLMVSSNNGENAFLFTESTRDKVSVHVTGKQMVTYKWAGSMDAQLLQKLT